MTKRSNLRSAKTSQTFNLIINNLRQKAVITFISIFLFSLSQAQNPIMGGKGLCDPQVRVYNDHVWLYATHDASIENKTFVMNDWWVWSSPDLVNWKYESTLKPEDTYYKKASTSCWATDAMSRNGKYYFYFSMGVTDIGVVVSDSPGGPWKDPIGKALIPSSMTPVEERDPSILMDDDGNAYIVFGVWDFYIARLNEDMVSLAEEPRKIEQDYKQGPYGVGKTDDKSFIHKYNGKYYLSWGCYYAMSDNVYGPYKYKGNFFSPERLAPEFQKSIKAFDRDRHGSFFELHNQWYFISNDHSLPGSQPYYRNSVIGYIHYRDNGEIEPIYIDMTGVGQYDAALSPIQAENYFRAEGTKKRECPAGGFDVRDIRNGSYLVYPSVNNLKKKNPVSLHAASGNPEGCKIEVREKDSKGKKLGSYKIPYSGSWNDYQTFSFKLKNKTGKHDLCLVFKGGEGELLRLDWIGLK